MSPERNGNGGRPRDRGGVGLLHGDQGPSSRARLEYPEPHGGSAESRAGVFSRGGISGLSRRFRRSNENGRAGKRRRSALTHVPGRKSGVRQCRTVTEQMGLLYRTVTEIRAMGVAFRTFVQVNQRANRLSYFDGSNYRCSREEGSYFDGNPLVPGQNRYRT